jgi:small-conductance mechanosensitive channel
MQAEDDRIAQEIQKKREKEGRDLELEKQKMMVSISAIFLVPLIFGYIVTSFVSDGIQIASPIIWVHIIIYLNYCRMGMLATQDPMVIQMALL